MFVAGEERLLTQFGYLKYLTANGDANICLKPCCALFIFLRAQFLHYGYSSYQVSKRDPSFFSFPRGSRSLFIGSRDVNQPSQLLFSIRFSLCVVKLRKWLKRGEYINIKFFKWGELLLNIWPKKQLSTVSTFKLTSWHIVKLHRSRNFVRVDIQQLKTNDHEFVDRNTG